MSIEVMPDEIEFSLLKSQLLNKQLTFCIFRDIWDKLKICFYLATSVLYLYYGNFSPLVVLRLNCYIHI